MNISNAIEGKRIQVKEAFWANAADHLEVGEIGRVHRLYWADDPVLLVDFGRSAGLVDIISHDFSKLELAPGEVES